MNNDEICETCDETEFCHCEYCIICNENINPDVEVCRHLFWYEKFGLWVGTGTGSESEWLYKELQDAFNKFISDHPQIAEDLIWTIENNKMGFDAIHYSGSIFGADRVECYLNNNWYGHIFTENYEDMTEEEWEKYALFTAWLIGLDENTKDENKLTIEWIRNAFFARYSHENIIQNA